MNVLYEELSNYFNQYDKTKSEELLSLCSDVFNADWCNENLICLTGDEGHPLAQDCYRSKGTGFVLGLASAIIEADVSSFAIKPFLSDSISRLKDTTLFMSTLFELNILIHLHKNGVIIEEFNAKTRKGDFEAKAKIDNQNIVIECKILNESNISKRIENFIKFEINHKAKIDLVFLSPPDENTLISIKKEIKEIVDNGIDITRKTDEYVIIVERNDEYDISYKIGFSEENRHKSTLRKTLKKKKNSKHPIWLFCGVFPEGNQAHAIEGFRNLHLEKNNEEVFCEITIVGLPHTMELKNYRYWNVVNGFNNQMIVNPKSMIKRFNLINSVKKKFKKNKKLYKRFRYLFKSKK